MTSPYGKFMNQYAITEEATLPTNPTPPIHENQKRHQEVSNKDLLAEDFLRRRNEINMNNFIEEGYDEDIEQTIVIEESSKDQEEEKEAGSNRQSYLENLFKSHYGKHFNRNKSILQVMK